MDYVLYMHRGRHKACIIMMQTIKSDGLCDVTNDCTNDLVDHSAA